MHASSFYYVYIILMFVADSGYFRTSCSDVFLVRSQLSRLCKISQDKYYPILKPVSWHCRVRLTEILIIVLSVTFTSFQYQLAIQLRKRLWRDIIEDTTTEFLSYSWDWHESYVMLNLIYIWYLLMFFSLPGRCAERSQMRDKYHVIWVLLGFLAWYNDKVECK